jgi:spermidine synthase
LTGGPPSGPVTWFIETTTPGDGHFHAIVRTIASARTAFQQADILETRGFGKLLVLDGRMQSSQGDEFIYHDALVHPGMLATAEPPRTALVVGGGEGATLREVLAYPSIQRAVMVDIDGELVELCRRHLPEHHQGAFDDPRTELRHEDARAFLENTSERFDFISLDLTEPMEEGPACRLFSREFYTLVRDRLTPGGTMTMQAGMTKVGELAFFTAMCRTVSAAFPVVAPYQAFISCFGVPWGFLVATKGVDPRRIEPAAVDDAIAKRLRKPLRYWDGITHQHSFALPRFIREAVAADTRVVTDAAPLIVT